jgi:phosphohistidine phosphatase
LQDENLLTSFLLTLEEMSKQVILVRHAKSDWANAGLDDFDRPLNERGKRDAPIMAKRLLDKKTPIDLFIASPAKRAAKTAKIFAETFGKEKDDILFIESLYLASTTTFYTVIESIADKHKSVALFSHNNGLTDFANLLTTTRIDNIPTTGIFAIKADCNSWADFKNAKKEFLFFDYPKSGD